MLHIISSRMKIRFYLSVSGLDEDLSLQLSCKQHSPCVYLLCNRAVNLFHKMDLQCGNTSHKMLKQEWRTFSEPGIKHGYTIVNLLRCFLATRCSYAIASAWTLSRLRRGQKTSIHESLPQASHRPLMAEAWISKHKEHILIFLAWLLCIH